MKSILYQALNADFSMNYMNFDAHIFHIFFTLFGHGQGAVRVNPKGWVPVFHRMSMKSTETGAEEKQWKK